MTPALDVAVVGAGPAGCAAALTAHRAGLRVAVYDKATFPRDKTCGDGLTTNALRLLEAFGIGPDDLGATRGYRPVARCRIVGPSGRVVDLPLPADGDAAATVSRSVLDAALADRVRAAGIPLHESTPIASLAAHDDAITLTPAEGAPVRSRWVVAADGHYSTVRRLLDPTRGRDLGEWHAVRQYFDGVTTDHLTVVFDRELLPGYAWIFPLPDGAANVGFGVLRRQGRSGRELKALWPAVLARPAVRDTLGSSATPAEAVHAWPIPTRNDPADLVAGRVLFAGDAAGVVDPMTGEGIAQAIETGSLAATAIAGSVDPGARYRLLVRRALGRDLRFAAVLGRVLESETGCRGALRAVDTNDWTRRNFARWMFEDYPRAALLTPDRWRRGFLRGRRPFGST